jgi:hypothetical protein
VSAGTTEHSTAPLSTRAGSRIRARKVSRISSVVWRVELKRQKPLRSAPSNRPTTMSLLPMSTATRPRAAGRLRFEARLLATDPLLLARCGLPATSRHEP